MYLWEKSLPLLFLTAGGKRWEGFLCLIRQSPWDEEELEKGEVKTAFDPLELLLQLPAEVLDQDIY